MNRLRCFGARAVLGCAVVAAACGGRAGPATPSAPPIAPPRPPIPAFRLPDGPRPLGYLLDLTVDPAQAGFDGVVDVALDLPPQTGFFWLNGRELTVAHAEVVGSAGERIAATAVAGGDDFIGFQLAHPVSGHATLHVAYTGHVGERGEGLYVERAGEDRFLYTQLEEVDARRLVPCFDEPSFKVPWQLTVHAPKGLAVFSNTRALADDEEGPARHRVRFAPTPPLPSYLLALAVGPFEIVDAGTAGTHRTPLRVIVPRGRAPQAAFAAHVVGELLDRLEAYFGIPFPYDKLDNVGRTVGRGAMENAGLIITGPSYLIAPRNLESDDFRRRVAAVAAHEMAHQWFGDLVTMSWWDDIWLNEAFASWMGDKSFAVSPDWHPEEDRARARLHAMEADLLASARQIRQPIASVDDIENAFDAITYEKGETVIGMFEAYVGAEPFRAGVRLYLEAHANRNATTVDFLGAISAAAGKDVSPAFTSFLDQPGLPAVSVTVECAGGAAKLRLAQERFVPAGAHDVAAGRWMIPVCHQAGTGKMVVSSCTLLDGPTAEVGLDTCPDWVDGNAGNVGYYLPRYTPEGLRALGAHVGALGLAERLGLLHDVRVQLLAGAAPAGPALAVVAQLTQIGPAPVVTEAADLADELVVRGVIGPANEAAYAAWVLRTFGPRARALGLRSRAGETSAEKAERARLLQVVAVRGHDRALSEAARAMAARWLVDPQAVPPDLVEAVLDTAAGTGDAAFVDRLLAELPKAGGYNRSVLLLAAFSALDPTALGHAAAILAEGDVGYALILGQLEPTGAARPVLFDYVRAHFEPLAAKLGDEGALLLESGRQLCDPSSLEAYRSFFSERARHLVGGPRSFAQVSERIETCIAAGRAEEASLGRALRGK